MTEQYDENKPLYGSRGIEIYLKLLKYKYPTVNIDELLQYSQMEPYQVTDDGHLFSQKQVNLFYEKIVELSGNKNIAREAGRFASSPEALGTMKGSVIGLLGPIRFYELIGTIANNISKSSHYAPRKLAHNKVEIIVTPYPGTVERPHQCQNRMGYWEAVSSVFSLKAPRIEHPKCLFKGDDVCHYIVTWKESPAFILRRIRNIAAVVLAIICLGVLFTSPAIVLAIALPVSVSIVLGLNWFARSLEYTVLVAACGDEALKFCRSKQEKIDLLLSDVIMPGMNGRELSEIARNECPEIKTVLMSGYTDNVIAERDGLDQGITFINKPLLPVSLATKIRSVLDSD